MIARSELVAAAFALLSACQVARPAGAYTPPEPPGPISPHDSGPPPVIRKPDAGHPSDGPDAGLDSGVAMSSNPLARLDGRRYLMRLDVYSSASATDSSTGTVLKVDNRLSNLMVADMYLQDNRLRAQETLCYQSLLSNCLSGCDKNGWVNDYDPALGQMRFPRLPPVDREYAVDGDGNLAVGQAFQALGFDEATPSAQTDLPSSAGDARVWLLDPSDAARTGVHVTITVTLQTSGPFPVKQPLNCNVSTVQLIETSFSGKLDLTQGEPLTTLPMRVDTSLSDAKTIAASGTPAMYCNKDTFVMTGAQQNSNDGLSTIRFQPYDGLGCPNSAVDYESMFPGNAMRPTSFM